MVVFFKTFDHYHCNFSFGIFFSCPVNCKKIWNWSLDRNLIMALLILAIYTVLFEKLYTILRYKQPMRHEITNLSFKIFIIMRFLRSLKCSKTTFELMFTTQKSNACSPWTGCFVFDWKYTFLVNMVKTENCQLKVKFGS